MEKKKDSINAHNMVVLKNVGKFQENSLKISGKLIRKVRHFKFGQFCTIPVKHWTFFKMLYLIRGGRT